MKIKFLSTLLIAAFTAFQVHAATTGKTLPTEPYVVDGYTPDTRTAEAKETYANRVVKSDVEGNNHSVFGQDNTVEAIHGSTSVYGNQNVVKVNAKDGNIFGDGSSIDGYQSQAIGDNNHLSGEQLSAVGMNNIVTGNHSHAYGGGNNITGDQVTAVGHYNLVKGNNATAIGYDNKVLSNEGTGVGERVEVSGLNASAFGSLAKATAESALALGSGSQATADSAVAVGNDSVASQKSSVAVGQSSKADGVFGTALGDSSNALANGSVAISVDSQAKGINSMAMGRNALTTHDNSVALGSDSVSKIEKPVNEATVQSITYSGFAGNTPVATVSVGSEGKERQLVNVGAGEISATSTDAINGSQLYATNDVINNVATTVTSVLGGTAKVDSKGNITMTDIGGTGENTVHDAIKSHTVKINQNAEDIKALEKKLPEVQAGDNTVVTSTTDANGKVTYTVSSKDFQPAIDANTAKIKENADGIKSNAKAIADNSANITKNTNAIADNTKAINTNTADIRAAEKLIDMNAKGIAQNTKDIAANTNYIKAVEQKLPVVTAGKNTTVDISTDANGKVTYTVSSADYQPAIDKNAKGIADNTKAIESNKAKIADVEQEAKRHTIVEAGHNMEVTSSKDENGATVYKVATSKDIGVNSLTVYNGPKITKDGIDARNTKIKNVTAGEDDNDAVNVSQLNQVKARQDAQSRALKQVRRTVINHGARLANVENRVSGLENKVDRLDHDVKKNRKRADAGISAVAAMANIPQVYLPGKSGVGVGVGYKHGQSAVAVGYSRSSDNGHHIIKLSAGIDTQKDVTIGAGYMYQY